MKVKANFDYNDTVLKRLVKKDEVIEVTEERGNFLMNKKHYGVPFVEFVEEVVEEVQDDIQEEVVEEKPKKGKGSRKKNSV